ncbi:unnamed protein product, partial [Musa banksii]
MISFSFSVLVIFVSSLLYLVIPGDDEDFDISFYMNTTATHIGVDETNTFYRREAMG